jgi:hypothetical protein
MADRRAALPTLAARLVWPVTATVLAIYLAMLLWTIPALTSGAGGLLPFDMRPRGYSLSEALAYLRALTPEARALYLGPQHWLDTVFPGLLALWLLMAYRRLLTPAGRWVLGTVAVAGAVFDYLENAAVGGLLRIAPEDVTAQMVAAASRWTQLKSAAVSLAMLALVFGVARALWRRRRGARA